MMKMPKMTAVPSSPDIAPTLTIYRVAAVRIDRSTSPLRSRRSATRAAPSFDRELQLVQASSTGATALAPDCPTGHPSPRDDPERTPFFGPPWVRAGWL